MRRHDAGVARLVRNVAAAVIVWSSLMLAPLSVSAQAWVPPKGEGNTTLTYQNSLARGHLLPNGQRASGAAGSDPVRAHSWTQELEFGLTDKLAVSFSIPYVRSRYGGPNPHRIGVHGSPITLDNGSYHGSFQDFRFGARLNLVTQPLVVTPFVEGIVPSHHYESRSHSAIGLDLWAVVLGANVGRFLDPVLPRGYFQTRASYAFVQKVAGIRPNRSRVDSELGYFVTGRLALRALGSLQLTHDGLDFPYASLSRDLSLNHDRLSRNNSLNLGGGVSFVVSESWDVFGSVSTLVWGENIHPHRVVAIGLNWHFRTRRAAPPPTP